MKHDNDSMGFQVKIVASCFGDRITGVGLAGAPPYSLIRILTVEHLIPVIVLDNTNHTTVGTGTNRVPNQLRYKLQVFIVEVSSWRELYTIIQETIKPSIWWNQMASFFLLDRSRGCAQYSYFLLGSWYIGLLNAKVICYRDNYGSYIFNYNPFTNQAPVSWQQFQVFPATNNHPFSFFMWDYGANNAICADLDFVKTKDLGGHPIVVEGKTRGFQFRNKTMANVSQQFIGRERILKIIFRALNVTPEFTGQTRPYMHPDVDLSMRNAPLTNAGVSITYPYQTAGLVIITKYRGHKTQLEKILSVTDVDSRIGMGIVYLITLIFLKFFVNRALVPALLNLVRITCNTGFSNLPDTTGPRIFLTGLLFYVVTMQGIYQGNLASLLTHKIPLRNVNSLDDLVNLDYKKIYGFGQLDYYVENSDLKKRLITTHDSVECLSYVIHNSTAACIDYAEGVIFDIARHNDLHLSREFVAQNYIGFVIKKSWYAEQKINKILASVMEADIFEPWDQKCNPTKLSDFEFDKEVLKNTNFKVIEFAEVRFAFVILGIGLTCAIIVFIVEISVQYLCRLRRCARVTLVSHRDRLIAAMREWKRVCMCTRVQEDRENFRSGLGGGPTAVTKNARVSKKRSAPLASIIRRCNPRRPIEKVVRIKVAEDERHVNITGF